MKTRPIDPCLLVDPKLLPYLNSRDDTEARRQMDRLLQDSLPVIRKIVQRKLLALPRAFPGVKTTDHLDAEDVIGEVLFLLAHRLTHFKQNPSEKAIRRYRAFVAAVTSNTCDEYLRKRFPRRSGTMYRLRYLIESGGQIGGVALWKGCDQELLCGLTRQVNQPLRRNERYGQLLNDPESVRQHLRIGGPASSRRLLCEVKEVLEWVGVPLLFRDLVNFVSHPLPTSDRPPLSGEKESQSGDIVPDPGPSPYTIVEQRIYLRALWAEITRLPYRQRVALFFHLRDVQLFTEIGIASRKEIAEAFGMTERDLEDLWPDLPLDDLHLSSRLGVTAQQVIGLRKGARERLQRRLNLSPSLGTPRSGDPIPRSQTWSA